MADAVWVLTLLGFSLLRRALVLSLLLSPVAWVVIAMGDTVRDQNYSFCEAQADLALAHDHVAIPAKPSAGYDAGEEIDWQSYWTDGIERECMSAKGYVADTPCAGQDLAKLSYTSPTCFRRSFYAAVAAQIR